ncbi:helix-turn-helix domain-containing protein [Tessaracoccus rhinocerotis]|uniref:Helix-turn-helix domain-containing protein n=1 Tax=Tessaracoccus rhinocerotis TaxID=1689449 RepID=A0A553JWT5_9ACTN|nr:TOBE domain-containing protein [Tessaracoccus rhinocerotis]TRY16890.1 helix-turn-helix domain-containing protein [Tessaracoccus rhinocerotis]
MTQIRISQAALLLGVSDDSIRRWAADGKLATVSDDVGRQVIEGAELARFAESLHADDTLAALDGGAGVRSARNHFTGIVTRILSDKVMSQVELQSGPNRVTSLISTEAVEQLGLEVGSIATAVVKATNVTIEVPR